MTKVFVRIVKDRPENPLDYLRQNLGDSLHQADSMAYLQSELEEARNEIQRIRGIIESINPDALREQQHLPDDLGKKNDETADDQDKCSEENIKPQKESESVTVTDKLEAASKLDSLEQSNSSPKDDMVKNSKSADDSAAAENQSNLAATKTDNN